MLGHTLLHYDIKLANKPTTRSYGWRATLVPYANIKLLMRDHKE